MWVHRLVNFMLIGFVCSFAPLACATVAVGQAAPIFTGVAADGTTINLDLLFGKTVVLEWTNHTCSNVAQQYASGTIPKLQQQAAAQGVVWLQVISTARGKPGHVDGASAKKLNAERGAVPANTIMDGNGEIGRLYGVKHTPEFVVINAQGELVYQGGIENFPATEHADAAQAENALSTVLADLAAGRPVAKSNIQTYGCAVKYAS